MMMNGHDVSILSRTPRCRVGIDAQDLTILGGFEGDVSRPRPPAYRTERERQRQGEGARSVEVEGKFEGEIRAAVLSFAPNAHARGLFLADKLGIRDGALVEGSFNLAAESDARPVDVQPEPAAVPPPSEATTVAAPRRGADGTSRVADFHAGERGRAGFARIPR